MSAAIHWFRSDLRLTDNPALTAACSSADELVLIHVRSPEETIYTSWGFPRWGPHRRRFRDQALEGLRLEIASRGRTLLLREGLPAQVLPAVAQRIGATRVYCEKIAAPEEMAEVAGLREAGLEVHEIWQSSLLSPTDLPFGIEDLPDVFTAFRHAIERVGVAPQGPLAVPMKLPPFPARSDLARDRDSTVAYPGVSPHAPTPGSHACVPLCVPVFDGSESSALAHVARYFASPAPQTYKHTRNRLTGTDYSTKLSPWLAVGSLSPRTAFQHLKAHEARFGANDGTYWIWFELLWRDFFRFWSLKHGVRLFRARGLGRQPPPAHDPKAFARWCAGKTGHAFVDAGMRELASTGFLSNRMRQVVASHLIHELACDWRAGAAWFESRLIDYDVCSNHGNWLYLAGRGADPRGGRWFDPDKQAASHDPDGAYRALWLNPTADHAP